jgi:predicted acyl esterase
MPNIYSTTLHTAIASPPDVITLYTQPFERDYFIKGCMQVFLTVKSNCPDTSFYVRVSIEKPEGDYCLRHDVTSLLYQLGEYKISERVRLGFTFDEHAFLLKKGERLRLDISSTDDNTYVSHTNSAGPYALQTQTHIAQNTVYLEESKLVLPVEI